MTIYTIVSNYFENGLFGSYTSLKRARKALETLLEEANDIQYYTDSGNYYYLFKTYHGEEFGAEIVVDELDFEFNHEIITDE